MICCLTFWLARSFTAMALSKHPSYSPNVLKPGWQPPYVHQDTALAIVDSPLHVVERNFQKLLRLAGTLYRDASRHRTESAVPADPSEIDQYGKDQALEDACEETGVLQSMQRRFSRLQCHLKPFARAFGHALQIWRVLCPGIFHS